MMEFKTVKVKEIGKVITGNTPPTSSREFYGEEYVFIKPTDMGVGERYVFETEEKLSKKAFEKYKKSLIPPQSTCVVTIGSLGKKLCLSKEYCFTNQAVNSIIPFEHYDKMFVYYLFKYINPAIENLSNGTASGRDNVSKGSFENFNVIVPVSKIHQQRIASILSAYDDLIEVNNQRIQLLEETARELYKEWFVRMRFPGWKETKFVKGVPEGWVYDTCYSFADIKGGGTPSTTNSEYWEGEINFFTPTDHSNSFFIFETEKKITDKGLRNSSTKMFSKYSTFITARGTVGNICLAGTDMAMNQSCFGIVSHNSNDCFFTFLFTDEMIKYLKLVANGATFDAITLNTFKNYKAPIPNIELRQLFFERASPFFHQIENLLQQNTQLRQIRDRLLPRLISGKLQVKEA